jgi:hypothetical protein
MRQKYFANKGGTIPYLPNESPCENGAKAGAEPKSHLHPVAPVCAPAHEFVAANAMMSASLTRTGANVTRCAWAMLCSRRKWP